MDIHRGDGFAVITLDPTQGTPLDSYTDPQGEFTMGNVLCEDPDMPGFRAYYRADEAGGREEWVFEYGDPWLDPPTTDLDPYTRGHHLRQWRHRVRRGARWALLVRPLALAVGASARCAPTTPPWPAST